MNYYPLKELNQSRMAGLPARREFLTDVNKNIFENLDSATNYLCYKDNVEIIIIILLLLLSFSSIMCINLKVYNSK